TTLLRGTRRSWCFQERTSAAAHRRILANADLGVYRETVDSHPVMLTGKAGTVVILHSALLRAVAPRLTQGAPVRSVLVDLGRPGLALAPPAAIVPGVNPPVRQR